MAVVQRVVYGFAAIAMLIGLIVVDVAIAHQQVQTPGPWGDLLRRGSILPIVLVITLWRASWEMSRFLRACGVNPVAPVVYLGVTFLFLSPWFSAAGWMGQGPAQVEGLFWQIVGLVGILIATALFTVLRCKPEGTLRDVGATLFTAVYLGFLPSFALHMRCGQDSPGQEGAWILLIILVVVKASDIGAYFVGTRLGKHKLIPSVSPGKSVEGSLAGLAFSALTAILLLWVNGYVTDTAQELNRAMIIGSPSPPSMMTQAALWAGDATRAFSVERESSPLSVWSRAIFFGITMSFFGQLGDLLESCFKRDAGAKDSGQLIPQFGGIMDLVDSPVLTLPVAWFLMTYVWNVL